MLDFEKQFYNEHVHLIAGTDEAGRGPLAGPVFIAAVIFPRDYRNDEINDSKKLSEKKREELAEVIKKDAICYSIVKIDADEIDSSNIYECSRKGMKLAYSMLKTKPDLLLTDAMPILYLNIDVIPIIKGDAKCLNIAAASILAKTSRDSYMNDLEKRYPNFSFSKHKGYGTKAHFDELEKFGPIDGIHRKSFAPIKRYYQEQLSLF